MSWTARTAARWPLPAPRVVPERDLDIDHKTVEHLRDEGLVAMVDLGDDERGLTLTREGRDLLDSHSIDRDDEPSQPFYAGIARHHPAIDLDAPPMCPRPVDRGCSPCCKCSTVTLTSSFGQRLPLLSL